MKLKKIAAIIAIATATSLIYGCSNTTNNSSNEVSQEQQQEQSKVVKVKSIDGNTITAVIGEISSNGGTPEMPSDNGQNGGGTPPEIPSNQGTGEGAPEIATNEDGTTTTTPEMPTNNDTNSDVTTGSGETPPDMPSGEAPSGGMPGNGGQMGGGMSSFTETGAEITFTVSDSTQITVEMLQGTQDGTIDNITSDSVLEITLNNKDVAESIVIKNLMAGGGFGGSDTVTNGTSANTIDTDSNIDNESYASTGDNENALRVDGATVTLDNVTIEKTAGESANTEDGDFYGQNAGFLALNEAQVKINNATVNTSVVNGNGIFSYGEGTVVTVSDSVINTTENNSGGIQTTGGGTMNASNLQVETQGNSAAAIRSDRGGGTVNVKGGTYTTNGTGSPSIYSTADISVSDAKLIANNSEAVVVEGKNSVKLENCDLVGDMSDTALSEGENVHNIMIYQSMSGDSEIGHSSFSATGGSITAKQGDMLYVTNTTCTIELSEVELNLANDVILRVSGNNATRGWGSVGSNGGKCTFVATSQQLDGNIIVDDISTLDMTLNESSTYTGVINPDGESGEVKVTLDSSSKWVLTGDSYVTEFNGNMSNVTTNGYKLYVNGIEAS